MLEYHSFLKLILNQGTERTDRTNVGTISLFGPRLEFDLAKGFPAVTTKKLAWKACLGELLWFLEGSGDERRLAEITHGSAEGTVTIWTPNALAPYWKDKAQFDGDLGRVYGVQWRRWRKKVIDINETYVDDNGIPLEFTGEIYDEVDQIKELVDGLKNNPTSRRHILSAWNVGELDQMALPPCHVLAQFYVDTKHNTLSCHMYQRSVDAFLGLPFNIASYATLTHMLAQVSGYGPGKLIISTGDAHIYKDHIEQVKEQLTREEYPLPTLWLNPEIKDIDSFTMDDVKLIDYKYHPTIKAKMAV